MAKRLYMECDRITQLKIEHAYNREFKKRFKNGKTVSSVIFEIFKDKRLSVKDKAERIFFIGRLIGQEDIRETLEKEEDDTKNQYR